MFIKFKIISYNQIKKTCLQSDNPANTLLHCGNNFETKKLLSKKENHGQNKNPQTYAQRHISRERHSIQARNPNIGRSARKRNIPSRGQRRGRKQRAATCRILQL